MRRRRRQTQGEKRPRGVMAVGLRPHLVIVYDISLALFADRPFAREPVAHRRLRRIIYIEECLEQRDIFGDLPFSRARPAEARLSSREAARRNRGRPSLEFLMILE